MKRVVVLVVAAQALLSGALPARAGDLERILDAGTLRAGVCLGAEPIGYRDGENVPRGYDVDMANLLAAGLGVRLELIEITGPTRVQQLLSGAIDVIVCNITATPERARSIDFSFPYLRTGIKLLVQRGAGIDGFEDLGAGRVLIVGRGTTGETLGLARAPEAEVLYVENPGDATLLMRQGKADAYVEDSLIIDYIAKAYPDRLEALPDVFSSDAISFGIRKGNPDLLRWLDLFASTFVSSGKYAETYGKWWGEPPPPLTPVW